MNKKLFLSGLMGVAFAASAISSQAANVLGVNWDPDSPLDLEMTAGALRETAVTGIGDELEGYGFISTINGDPNFCGCDLTYVFSSYIVADADADEIIFSGGVLSMYAQATGSYDVTDPTSAEGTAGELFLELSGHAVDWATIDLATTFGSLYGTFSGSLGGTETGDGSGLFDATGGAALAYFDTNTREDGSDFSFSSSFQPANAPIGDYVLSGTAELFGDSQNVSAPGTIALLGFGLALLGTRRRIRKG